MRDLFFGQGTGHSIMLLAIVIAVGLYLGKFKIKGVTLGSTWILFVGILLSHFGFRAEGALLHFLKEFGLILFVFSIGLQVGPGFFHSFKKGGLTLNMLAVSLIVLHSQACPVLEWDTMASHMRKTFPLYVPPLKGALPSPPRLLPKSPQSGCQYPHAGCPAR